MNIVQYEAYAWRWRNLQGELHGATRTIDLRRKLVNGRVKEFHGVRVGLLGCG
jgi:hypothetical protein